MVEQTGRKPLAVGDDALPTEDDVAFYHEHGYYISKRILPDELVDAARRGVERFLRGERDDELPIESGFSDWRPGDDERFRNIEFLALRMREVRELALSPVIGAIASRLAGAAAIRLWDDQLVWKEPVDDDTTGVVGWHTDRAYWMTCTSEDMLTAWIPFHDCPAEMGPLMVLDGSHRWEGTDQMRSFKNRNLADVGVPIPVQDVKELIRAMALLKGQMSFHHCRTVHGSATNRGSRPRVSLAVHLQDGANHWRPFCNVNGSRLELANDRMTQRHPDGTPDYSDPALFPPYGLD